MTAKPDLLDGRWRLLFTSRPGTASPIQNTFTGVDAFSVFQVGTPIKEGSFRCIPYIYIPYHAQDVDLSGETPSIANVVDFGPNVGYLKVEALASTDTRPLEGFTPR